MDNNGTEVNMYVGITFCIVTCGFAAQSGDRSMRKKCSRCHQEVPCLSIGEVEVSAEKRLANKLRAKACGRINRLEYQRLRLEDKARKKAEDKEYLQHCTTQFINSPTDANELLMHRALLS